MIELQRLMTVAEAAKHLSVHPEMIRRAVRNGTLSHYRFAGCIRIAQEHLSDYLSANLHPARDPAIADKAHTAKAAPVVEFQFRRRMNRMLERRVKR